MAIRGLYVIADMDVISGDLIAAVTQAIEGGASVVQYRDKSSDHGKRLGDALALHALCKTHGIPFIINDDVELTKQSGADGIHLGRDDAAIESVRAQLGADTIIGISCYNDLKHASDAVAAGANYIAFGSFYASPTKPDAVKASHTLLTLAKQKFSLPIVAIGGITSENGADLVAAGADALAVITGVFATTEIRNAAEAYAALFTH